MSRRDEFVQHAIGTPFDNSTNGFTSTDVQAAIEEVKNLTTSSRWQATCAFDGTGSTGRWLEWMKNNPSNNSPLVVPRAGTIKELSFSSVNNSTTTVTIFKNGVSTAVTISTSGTNSATVTGLNLTFVATDKISAQVTAGSSSRPSLFVFAQFS